MTSKKYVVSTTRVNLRCYDIKNLYGMQKISSRYINIDPHNSRVACLVCIVTSRDAIAVKYGQ